MSKKLKVQKQSSDKTLKDAYERLIKQQRTIKWALPKEPKKKKGV